MGTPPDQPPRKTRGVPSGIFLSIREQAANPPRPGLIFDRDGVLIKEKYHLCRPDDVVLEQGTIALLRRCQTHGMPLGVATNQAGIDRGYFGWTDYHAVAARLDALLVNHGLRPLTTAACAYHPDHTPGWGDRHAYWRKPGPGLCCLLAQTVGLDLSGSWIIGDRMSDLQAGRSAGMKGGVHVLSGYGKEERTAVESLNEGNFHVLCVSSLLAIPALLPMMLADMTPDEG